MVIAIDGPAGAGKSTVARALAERLGFTYLDSGAMYRSIALAVIRAGVDPDNPAQVEPIAARAEISVGADLISLDGEEVTAAIRSAEVTAAASRVSVHRGVRDSMVARQRAIVADGGWVAEGRDIGTVVCPESPLKIYLIASAEERARRRAEESDEDLASVLGAMKDRDSRDAGREHGALVPAIDSVEVDTTGLSVGAVVEKIAELAAQRGLCGERAPE